MLTWMRIAIEALLFALLAIRFSEHAGLAEAWRASRLLPRSANTLLLQLLLFAVNCVADLSKTSIESADLCAKPNTKYTDYKISLLIARAEQVAAAFNRNQNYSKRNHLT